MESGRLVLKSSLVMFGGKGGTGKTTCASAAAIRSAANGLKTLLASTDPAHSLGDCLGLDVGARPVAVPDTRCLHAVELDTERYLERFRMQHGAVLREIADRGTFLDHQDIDSFLGLSLPGLDELMAVLSLTELIGEGRYDLLVVDTAPTGHTVRFLELPAHMQEWLRVLDLMLEKHRYMASVFGRYVPDEADRFISGWSKRLGALRSLLADPRRSEFVPVMVPEAMSIAETERLVTAVRSCGVRVDQAVINRVVSSADCAFCRVRARDQGQMLAKIKRMFPDFNKVTIPLLPAEVTGVERLEHFAQMMMDPDRSSRDAPIPPAPRATQSRRTKRGRVDVGDLKYIIVGGKGGVGKTSVAAATGIHLAERGQRVLVFSSDPAHSLSDSFGCRVGDSVSGVSGVCGLYAMETDARRVLDSLRQRHANQMNELFDGLLLAAGVGVQFDRQVMAEIVSLTPPGLDELMGLLTIMDSEIQDRHDVFVIDSAATGHLLRFLELPDLAAQWFRALVRMVLRYQGADAAEEVLGPMVSVIKQIHDIRSAFTDAEQTGFISVATPEIMVVRETGRLLDRLDGLGLSSRCLVANMVVPPLNCGFCSQVRRAQAERLKVLQSLLPSLPFVEVPLFPQQVRGVETLRHLARVLYGSAVRGGQDHLQ